MLSSKTARKSLAVYHICPLVCYKLMVRPTIKHRFGGNHALGGERNDTESLKRWFERLAIVYPDLKLKVVDIWAKVSLCSELILPTSQQELCWTFCMKRTN